MRLSSSPHREGSTLPVLAPSGQDMAAAAETAPRIRKSLRDVVIRSESNKTSGRLLCGVGRQDAIASPVVRPVILSSPVRCPPTWMQRDRNRAWASLHGQGKAGGVNNGAAGPGDG